MAVALAPFPVYRAANNNGAMLAGGLVDTFAAGTFTPLATFSDPAGATPNTNPVVLDASGRANIYFTVGVAYKIRQRDSTGVTLWTVDNFVVNPQGDLTLINDYSSTVAQSNETLDPGEAGTEVLAQSASDEIKQLRFVEQEMKGTPSWRTTYTRRHMTLAVNSLSDENVTWTATGSTSWRFRGFIPDGWQAGSTLILNLLRRFNTSSAGTAKMQWQFNRYRDNTAALGGASTTIDFAPGDLNSHLLQITQDGSGLQAGDGFLFAITRLGDDVGDTNTGFVVADAWYLDYSGVASR